MTQVNWEFSEGVDLGAEWRRMAQIAHSFLEFQVGFSRLPTQFVLCYTSIVNCLSIMESKKTLVFL
jgi:hypothetical protein